METSPVYALLLCFAICYGICETNLSDYFDCRCSSVSLSFLEDSEGHFWLGCGWIE